MLYGQCCMVTIQFNRNIVSISVYWRYTDTDIPILLPILRNAYLRQEGPVFISVS